MAYRNNHFGARYFAKEDLPRIRYANPNLDIVVDKKPSSPDAPFPSELVLSFTDGRSERFTLDNMWSTDILTKVLDTAGGSFWPIWKAARERQGLPALDPPEPRAPAKAKRAHSSKKRARDTMGQEEVTTEVPAEHLVDLSKTGAARILP